MSLFIARQQLTRDIDIAVFRRNLVRHHLFADDKQLYRSGKISDIGRIRLHLSQCILNVRDWCSSRRLQLNPHKTVWFSSRSNLRKLASTVLSLTVGDDVIKPVTVVRDLGILVDAELTMKHHISRVVSSCFFQLRGLRHIRRSVGEEVTKRLVASTTAMLCSRDFLSRPFNHCNE